MHGTSGGRSVRVVIPGGSSASQISSILGKRGVVRASWLFRIVARLRGVAAGFRPGDYTFRTALGYSAVIDILKKGPPVQVSRVTIPEGKTLGEVARIVELGTGIPEQRFRAAAASGSHHIPFLPSGTRNLEGFLFP